MYLGPSSRRAAQPPRQFLITLTMTIVMVISALALAPRPADAQLVGTHPGTTYTFSNGVDLKEGKYLCAGKPATPVNAHTIRGTAGDDVILAMGDKVKRVLGYAGNDTICVVTPGASINGGNGNDIIFTPDLPADWPPHLQPAIATTWGANGHDTIYGGSGWDNISGGPGHDSLLGGDGYDYIWGDGGNDIISGGPSGNRGPSGVATPGDLCIDEHALISPPSHTRASCERGDRDPHASPSMPNEPSQEIFPSCGRHCGFSHFR